MRAGKLILFLIAGGLSRSLAVSGMTDPARVIGFLDVFGNWDPALLFVMAGAVSVYGSDLGLAPPRWSKFKSALGRLVADRLPARDRRGNFRLRLGPERVLPRTFTRQSWRLPRRSAGLRTKHDDRHVVGPTISPCRSLGLRMAIRGKLRPFWVPYRQCFKIVLGLASLHLFSTDENGGATLRTSTSYGTNDEGEGREAASVASACRKSWPKATIPSSCPAIAKIFRLRTSVSPKSR